MSLSRSSGQMQTPTLLSASDSSVAMLREKALTRGLKPARSRILRPCLPDMSSGGLRTKGHSARGETSPRESGPARPLTSSPHPSSSSRVASSTMCSSKRGCASMRGSLPEKTPMTRSSLRAVRLAARASFVSSRRSTVTFGYSSQNRSMTPGSSVRPRVKEMPTRSVPCCRVLGPPSSRRRSERPRSKRLA